MSHVVVNVSNLERSLAFYERHTPLRAWVRTTAPPQAFTALGIPQGEFDGWMLCDATGIEPGVSVHLVEWRTPSPSGVAYPTFFHAGFARMCIMVADPMSVHDELIAGGVEPFARPRDRGPVAGGMDVVSFTFPDPDGIAIHISRRDRSTRPDVPPQLYHVSPVVPDVDAACDFFGSLLGLGVAMRLSIPEPIAAGYGLGAAEGQFDAAILGHASDPRFHVDAVNWVVPGVTGVPYTEANNVGIQRLAFEVDDVEDAHRALLDELPTPLRDTVRGPESWDLGDAGTRRVVVFRSEEGLTLELVEQTRFSSAP